MTNKLDDMWSSKWILPEHRDSILKDERSIKKVTKPVLDEQEIQLVEAALHGSIINGHQVTLTVYGLYGYRTVTGTAEKVDRQLSQVKIILFDPYAAEPEHEWIALADILKAELAEQPEWTQEEKDAWLEAEHNDRWDELEWDRDESIDG